MLIAGALFDCDEDFDSEELNATKECDGGDNTKCSRDGLAIGYYVEHVIDSEEHKAEKVEYLVG